MFEGEMVPVGELQTAYQKGSNFQASERREMGGRDREPGRGRAYGRVLGRGKLWCLTVF